MILVVDASVTIKWYFQEHYSREARSLVSEQYKLFAPDLLLSEVGSIIWQKVKKGELPVEEIGRIYYGIQNALFEIVPTQSLGIAPIKLACELNHSVYDCMYLAAAEERHTRFITADRKFHDKVKQSSYAECIVMIQDFVKEKAHIQERDKEEKRER